METLSPDLMNAVTGQYQLEIKKIFQEGWKKISGVKLPFWGACGWLALILIIIGSVETFLFVLANHFNFDQVAAVITFSGNLINGLISSVLTTSLFFLLVQHIANQKVRAKDIFNFNGVLKRLVTMAVIDFILKLALLFFSLLGFFYLNLGDKNSLLIHGAFATLTAVTFYLIFQLSLTWHMAWLLVIEKQMTIWFAVKISFLAMNKKFFKNIVLLILIISFGLLSAALTCGIALIWTLPMVLNMNAIWYRQIFGIEAVQQN